MNFLTTPRRISLALGVSRFVKLLLGIVVLFLSIKYFGTTFERDSWVLSLAFWSIIICFIYSPINDIFRTKFIFIKKQEGEEAAIRAVNSLMNLFCLSYVLIIIIVFFCVEPFEPFLAPGFDEETKRYLSMMIFSLIPFFILQQHSNVLIALLNTYESYFYPEIVFLTSSVVNIVAIVFLSDVLGIYSLVISTTINTALMVIILTIMLKKKVSSFHLISMENIKWASPFVKVSLPMYLSAIFSQIYLFVEKSMCTNFGEGMVSIFDYARQIATMPYVVFSTIVPIVMTPLLSLAFINGDEDKFSDEMRRLLHLFLYLTSFFITLMIVNAEQVSWLLFSMKNGTFIIILSLLCIGTLFMTITMICGQALIARNRIVDYVIAVIIGNSTSIALCFALVPSSSVILQFFHLTPRIEYLTASFFFGQVVSSLIAFNLLKIKRKSLVMKSLVIQFSACITAYILTHLFQYLMSGTLLLSINKFYVVLDLLICACLVFFILLSMLLIFDSEERKTVLGLCTKISQKYFKHKE